MEGEDDEVLLEEEEEEEEELDEEEDMEASDNDEEYNLTHYGIAQALPVPDGPPDPNAGPPQTAEEYLQWVRYEASKCPRITRKEIAPEKLAAAAAAAAAADPSPGPHPHGGAADGADQPGGTGRTGAAAAAGGRGGGRRPRVGTAAEAFERAAPSVPSSCQDWARPSSKWLRVFIQDFAQLRRALLGMQQHHAAELRGTQLPAPNNVAAWDRLCFEQWQPLEAAQQQGGGQQQQPEGEHAGGARPPPPPPPEDGGAPGVGPGPGSETDRLCGPVLRTVLAMDQVAVCELIQRHVAQLPSQPCLSYLRSQWLFALAAVLQRPVPPDVSAALRSLVRVCAAWRGALAGADDPSLPRLNILLAVAGGYFGQDEELCLATSAMGLGDLA